MLLAMKIKIAIAAAALAEPGRVDGRCAARCAIALPTPSFAEIAARPFQYRLAGDFSRDGKPVEAPLREAAASGRHQDHEAAGHSRANMRAASMTAAALASPRASGHGGSPGGRRELARCHGLRRMDHEQDRASPHRLPTDEEWAFAAGEKARDEALPLVDPVDPAQAWIARYEAEANRARPVALDPQPVGTFGRNENGLHDIGRQCLGMDQHLLPAHDAGADGAAQVTNTNCGVRVVQGAHRTYMTDFIRDPRTGGCAAGVPPANLGFRLVVEDRNWPKLRRMIVANFKSN